jgi:hypothetical protein
MRLIPPALFLLFLGLLCPMLLIPLVLAAVAYMIGAAVAGEAGAGPRGQIWVGGICALSPFIYILYVIANPGQ